MGFEIYFSFLTRISTSHPKARFASLSIAAFVLKLIRTNGKISKTEVSASYRHVSLKILNEFPKVLDNVSLELGKQRDQFRVSFESLEVTFESPTTPY